MPYLAVASIPASAVTFMAIPGHEQAKDAVVIAQAYGMTASTAFADGRGPGGLADEERQFAACPATRGWNHEIGTSTRRGHAPTRTICDQLVAIRA